MRFLVSVDKVLVRLELVLAVVAMTGVAAILIAQVLFRYVLQSPLFFAEELALILMIVATFAGFSLMVADGRLVTIDIFGGKVAPITHARIAWAMRVVVLVLGVLLAWFSIRYLMVPWVWIERSATLGVPRAALYAIVTAELCFLVLHQCVQLCTTFSACRATDGEAV
ncbi:TRAP transporter small permease [Celeribacter sp. SCSIO 80788]|uniref:TRAP transporter small permease n=1 Tax=Celeribacter sp. SCSIO 80788 TaxID=3117013 RepID=UPI003DA2E8E1